ncbi:MAG: response regulator [Acidobacteria bacterium]|nr:response regulator [Acidobacteriota bacterium]
MPEGRWLLILEDEPAMARVLARELRHVAEPRVCATCEAAREALGRPGPLVAAVLDLELPDGSGLELLAKLRRTQLDLPILVVSGGADRDAVNEAQRLGAEFAHKPFHADNLRAFAARTLRLDARRGREDR